MQSFLHLPGIPVMRSVSCGITTHEQKKAAKHVQRSSQQLHRLLFHDPVVPLLATMGPW